MVYSICTYLLILWHILIFPSDFHLTSVVGEFCHAILGCSLFILDEMVVNIHVLLERVESKFNLPVAGILASEFSNKLTEQCQPFVIGIARLKLLARPKGKRISYTKAKGKER